MPSEFNCWNISRYVLYVVSILAFNFAFLDEQGNILLLENSLALC